MEAVWSSETSVPYHIIARCHDLKDQDINFIFTYCFFHRFNYVFNQPHADVSDGNFPVCFTITDIIVIYALRVKFHW